MELLHSELQSRFSFFFFFFTASFPLLLALLRPSFPSVGGRDLSRFHLVVGALHLSLLVIFSSRRGWSVEGARGAEDAFDRASQTPA